MSQFMARLTLSPMAQSRAFLLEPQSYDSILSTARCNIVL
jgi:hypothetical protein